MSEQQPHEDDIFDVERIRRLVALMEEHDLGEIDLKQSDQRIRIRRGAEPQVTGPIAAAPPAAVPAAAPPAAAGGGKAEVADGTFIKSPMVGTFYQSANPDSEPFVRVGDVVGVDTTVCIIEAMKVFNEIPAECSGKIVAILVENGEPVEYGQPLFKLDTNP